jgi:hypothetical protein
MADDVFSPLRYEHGVLHLIDQLQLPMPSEVTGIPLGDAPGDRTMHFASDARLGMLQSVIKDNQQLIYNWNGNTWFYRLGTDPGQSNNQFDATDPDVLALWDLLTPRIEMAMPLVQEHIPVVPDGLSLP